MAKGKVLETIVNIAGEISPTLGKTIKDVTGKLDGVNVAAIAAGTSIAAIGTAAVAGAIQAGKYLAELGDSYNQAVGDLAAQTGLTGAALDDMADSMQDIYAMNLGESMEDVADSMATVRQTTQLSGDALEDLTADALVLRDTFDYDVAESTRAAQALMENFGITGAEAMNLIASGAQNGLDFSGEMIDTISEYSVQFAKIGLDADDMFNILQSGADGTAWNLDKVGDSIKEFSIRAIDGSKTTVEGFEAIGMNADEMMQTFASGGKAANDAFYDVLNGLLAMEDPVARDAAGVKLFGTMWEDMGVDAMKALAGAEQGAYATGDAMGELMEIKYGNLEDAFGAVKRQAEVALIPLASTFAGLLTDLAPKLGAIIERFAPIIEDVTERAMPFVDLFIGGLMDGLDAIEPLLPVLADALMDIFEAIAPIFPIVTDLAKSILPLLVSIIAAIMPAITVVLDALMPVFDLVADLVSIILPPLTSLINALIPTIQMLANVFSGALGNAIARITPVLTGIMDVLGNIIDFIANVFTGNWQGAWENVVDIFTGIFNLIPTTVESIINHVIDVINGIIKGINSVSEHVGLEIGLIPHVELPRFATGGFTDGLSLAGEERMEAIISFDPNYRAANLGYWAQAGQMLGATPEDAGFELSGITRQSAVIIDMGGITFAPNITITGNADRQSIIQAIRDEYPEFMDMLEEFWIEKGATVYG